MTEGLASTRASEKEDLGVSLDHKKASCLEYEQDCLQGLQTRADRPRIQALVDLAKDLGSVLKYDEKPLEESGLL